jgi:hypothetical protein
MRRAMKPPFSWSKSLQAEVSFIAIRMMLQLTTSMAPMRGTL